MSGVIYPINDRKYTAEDVEIFNCTRTSGVFSVLDFDCSLSGNVVTIGKGLGWLKNGDFSGKAVAFKDITNLTLDGADSAFDRYDVVAVRYDATKKDPEIVVIKGEASEIPVMPKRSTESYLYELFLYSILRKAGESTASFENVTDLRENKNYCGIMEDSVTSAVAPVYETIVENTELKVNDKLDFDYEKYEYLIATVRMMLIDCDVILTKSYPGGSGQVKFLAFSGIGSAAGGSSTFYFRAQIGLNPNSATGHSVVSAQWSDNPNFTDLGDNATIVKIVGVTKQPKGYVAVDDVYNAESHNAQSGQAISMALSGVLKASKDYTRIYVEDNLGVVDVTYDPTSDNAQSGKAVAGALASKQDVLNSGENIKTINGESILGSGNIVVEGAGGCAVNELEENLIQLVEYGSIYSQRDFSWKNGYIYPNGGVNSGVTNYEMTELLEIPNGATICKIDNYSGNAGLSAIAFYSNNEQSAENLVNSTVKETYDGAIEIEIPSNATHYACSKNKTNTDFSCSFLIDSNLKALINENTSNIENLTASVDENTLKIDAKADKDEVSKLNELCDYYEEEVTFTWTDGFYVPSSGAVNSSATAYDKSQALNIPDDVSELKLDGYTASAALGAICFYTSNDFRPETFLKAVTYSAEEGAKTLKVPYGAKYFGCSKAKTSTNFKLCLLREGNTGRLNRGVKRNGDICFYNKKVVIGGDSTTHGVGGTGFAQDGDVIATFKGKTYKRNPNGYCWANLFKNLLETKYGAEVAINACTGSNANDWANHITELVPTDTDVFILMIGTNDRVNTTNRTDYESIRTIMRSSFASIKRYCDLNDIDFVLCSPAPVSAENEVFTNEDGSNTYAINICQIQEIIKEWTMDSGTKFRDTYTKLYDYYFVKGTDNIGTFADGLHPDDAMYYVMFHIYCSMFRVGATVPKLSIPN